MLICVPEEAQVGETLYIFDDLLKRNFVTCVIRPKINIIQIDVTYYETGHFLTITPPPPYMRCEF